MPIVRTTKLIHAQIINHIQQTLASSPGECFILQGYSQGAAATVNALSSLTSSQSAAVKGVFLIGDPEHKSGLACNVDNNGGTTTEDVNGLSVAQGSIPSAWITKTLDVCIYVGMHLASSTLQSLIIVREMVYLIRLMDLESTSSICNTQMMHLRRNLARLSLSASSGDKHRGHGYNR